MELQNYCMAIVTIFVIYIVTKWAFRIIRFLYRTFKTQQALKIFPMENYHWFLGHLTVHPGPKHEGLMKNLEWTEKHPRYYTLFVGPLRPTLILNHPETIKTILKTSEPKNTIGGGGYTLLSPWLGDGLVISSGEKWFRNRKLLTPGFHFDVLKPYIRVYNRCADTLMAKFESVSADTGRTMDIYSPVSLCTLDVILSCAFSMNESVQERGFTDEYVDTIDNLGKLIMNRGRQPSMYFDSLYYCTTQGKQFSRHCQISHDFAKNVISKRKNNLESASNTTQRGRHIDFLDILLIARDEDGKGLTDQEINDEVVTFLFGGHDTTASAISWILYNLAKNPEIQMKAGKEVDSILRDRATVQWDDINRMSYLTRCIKESLRLYPPVYSIARQTTKELVIDDKVVPPHTGVYVSIWNCHHNPEIWTNAMVYDPDRFLPDRMANMDSHAFIPFSAGPRNCIGQVFAMNEIKTIVAKILHKFEFAVDPSKEVRLSPDIVLKPLNGIYISFKKKGSQ